MTGIENPRELAASVLVLGNYRPTLSVARALTPLGYRIIVTRRGGEGCAEHSRHVAECWDHPPIDDEGAFVSALARFLAERPDVTVVYPVWEPCALAVARHHGALPNDRAYATPPPETVITCLDKPRMLDVARAAGVPCAPFAVVDSHAALLREAAYIGFPLVVRPVSSSRPLLGDNALILRDRDHLLAKLPSWPPEQNRLIAQRYVSGPRYNVYFAADRGRAIRMLSTKTVRTHVADGTGLAVAARAVPLSAELRGHMERTLAALRYHGVGLFQMLGEDGRSTFLELNPRIGANHALAEACGMELSRLAIDLARGPMPAEPLVVGESGLSCAWTYGELRGVRRALAAKEIGAFGAVRAIGRAVTTAVAADVHLTWSRHDPLPTLALFARLAGLRGFEAAGRRRRQTAPAVKPEKRAMHRRDSDPWLLFVVVGWLATAGCIRTQPFMGTPPHAEAPAPAAIDHRLLLIGDAGDPDPKGEPALYALGKQVELMPARTTVVFLGDNVYETGMPDPSPLEDSAAEEILDEALLNLFASRRDSERRVKAQVKAIDVRGTHAIFVPGNHDWDQFGIGGWGRVRELRRYVGQLAGVVSARLELLPEGGCPGPVTVDVGRHARLIVLDTQWWLEAGEKPNPENNPTGCAQTTEDQVVTALVQALHDSARAGRAAIIVAHHPLRSRGPHGGYVYPPLHLFPLLMLGSYVPTFAHWIPIPGIGTLMAAGRAWFSPNPQDMSSSVNEHMRSRLSRAMDESAAAGAAPLLYASGHEHSLQVFRSNRGPRYLVVSGLGSHAKALPVGRARDSLFAHSDPERPGFVKIDFLRDGRVRLAIVEWTAERPDGVEVWDQLLDTAPSRYVELAADGV
jgi:predicted ATP-grasp superfamily ATP-dependent carboligase